MTAHQNSVLSQTEVDRFSEDGFLLVEDFFDWLVSFVSRWTGVNHICSSISGKNGEQVSSDVLFAQIFTISEL